MWSVLKDRLSFRACYAATHQARCDSFCGFRGAAVEAEFNISFAGVELAVNNIGVLSRVSSECDNPKLRTKFSGSLSASFPINRG